MNADSHDDDDDDVDDNYKRRKWQTTVENNQTVYICTKIREQTGQNVKVTEQVSEWESKGSKATFRRNIVNITLQARFIFNLAILKDFFSTLGCMTVISTVLLPLPYIDFLGDFDVVFVYISFLASDSRFVLCFSSVDMFNAFGSMCFSRDWLGKVRTKIDMVNLSQRE